MLLGKYSHSPRDLMLSENGSCTFEYSHWHCSYGYFDFLKVSASRCKQWEDTILANFAASEGWVVSNDAVGNNAWNDAGEGGFSFFSQATQQQSQQQGGPIMSSPSRTVSSSSNASRGGTGSTFPSGGRPLGSATRRVGHSDPRQARLQAVERRAGASSEDEKV